MRLLLLSVFAAPALIGAAPAAELELRLERLRNDRGVVHLCLTRNAAQFPDCGSDPRAVKRTVPVAQAKALKISMEPGAYALSVFHDENRNGKLDTFLGIPKEGFGFSRNPVVRFGPPSFKQVRVEIAPGLSRQTVRMQYLL